MSKKEQDQKIAELMQVIYNIKPLTVEEYGAMEKGVEEVISNK